MKEILEKYKGDLGVKIPESLLLITKYDSLFRIMKKLKIGKK